MPLDLRPNCEWCDVDLPPASPLARICSYECTFCATCVDDVLRDVCPNCGGGFVARPVRPSTAWRTDTSRTHDPPSATRVHATRTAEEAAALTDRLHRVAPGDR